MRGIQKGASSYLLKTSTAPQIIDAIRSVAERDVTLDRRVAHYIISTFRDRTPPEKSDKERTKQKLEILALLSEGLLKKRLEVNSKSVIVTSPCM